MNKKRFLIFLLTLILIILIPTLYFLLRRPQANTSIFTASSKEEVNQFYYRAVPGLRMAEEADLIREINKQLEWPGQSATLVIDRIWYNANQATIFYHVEGITQEVYLGGEFYLPDDEPVEKQPFHGSKSIGGDEEKGIIFHDSYYSCLKLPPLRDDSGQVFTEIETLTFTPYINIPKQDEENQMENLPLKSFDIALNYNQEEETVTKFFIDRQIEIHDKHLKFYQVDLSPSVLRVYFQYLNSGRDQVYRIKGSYTTDKGETQIFDAFTKAITDFPYHYTFEISPFHILPETMQLQIDSIFCIGNDKISFQLDTNQFGRRNRSHDTEIGRNRIKGTEVFISNVTLNNQFAEIYIAFQSDIDAKLPYTRLYPLPPQWAQEQAPRKKPANYLLVLDGDFQLFNLDEWSYGADVYPGEGISIRLDRQFWNEADSIHIRLENLTYMYQISKAAPLQYH